MVEIAEVKNNSLAAQKGIEAGDSLIAINGSRPGDYIDYMSAISAGRFSLTVAKQGDEDRSEKHFFNMTYGDRVGIEFDSIIFDDLKKCNNSCCFCFVDQQPPDVRDSLNLKDDDYRFSFLQGSFITLTNLSEEEWSRIIKHHLSPLYISVHTTNPELRKSMMKNPEASRINEQLDFLAENGISFHLQLVICPGCNDGKELDRTLNDLLSYTPETLLSVGIVPVGLTSWRPQDDDLVNFEADSAENLLRQVESWQNSCREKHGKNNIYMADEFYLLAGEAIPEDDHYGDYPQLENGIGLSRLSRDAYFKRREDFPDSLSEPGVLNIVTARLGGRALKPVWQDLRDIENLNMKLIEVDNSYLGEDVTVTGLLSGEDILDEVLYRKPTGKIILPSVIFNDDGLTLDGYDMNDFKASPVDGEFVRCAGVEEVLEVIFDEQADCGHRGQAQCG